MLRDRMRAETEFLILPYDAAGRRGSSLLHRLVAELNGKIWRRMRAAVAFARTSANVKELHDALAGFAEEGGTIGLTFGADQFGGEGGSDFEAINALAKRLDSYPNVRVHLYHEDGRTFHPKLYLFDDEAEGRARAIVGSSNWSRGGLAENVEVNVIVDLDLADGEHAAAYARLGECFDTYWSPR